MIRTERSWAKENWQWCTRRIEHEDEHEHESNRSTSTIIMTLDGAQRSVYGRTRHENRCGLFRGS